MKVIVANKDDYIKFNAMLLDKMKTFELTEDATDYIIHRVKLGDETQDVSLMDSCINNLLEEQYEKREYIKIEEIQVINNLISKLNENECRILNAYAEIPIHLEEVDFVFVKKNGVYEGTDSCKYPFKVIHYELGIPCRFHDFRDTHATKLIESGADIKAVSKRLGHRSIDFTYNIYVRVTQKMENETADKFEEICSSL